MSTPPRRAATPYLTLAAALLLALPARAVIVRGTVTNPLGAPVANARVQLVQGRQVAAFTVSGPDGTFEIRSTAPGRFVLLTSAAAFTPSIGQPFYGGRTAVVTRNVVMEYTTVTAQLGATSTARLTPINELATPITLIPQAAFATDLSIVNNLRQFPGIEVVQTGQTGGPVSLYVRGGSPDANKIRIDNQPAENIGGRFDFSTIPTIALAGVAGVELNRGPNSALYGTGAEASVVALSTQRGDALRPVFNYSGDAGNFHTYRNEATVSGALPKLDYLAAFSRFDTSNALPRDEYHATNAIANLGYSIFSNTQARFTLRDTNAGTGLSGPHDIYGLSASAKQSDEDIYSGFTIENQFDGNWHNLARYGIARKREQVQQFAPVGIPYATLQPDGLFTLSYYGDLVTLRGANGYTAAGQAAILSPTFDTVSNRDNLRYESDYTFPYRITALFSFDYENERGRLLAPNAPANLQDRIIKRTNYLYTLQLQGDIKHRVFYSLGGAVEQNDLYGIAGTPRLGLAYVPVLPGHRIFRGTRLRANIATGVQEPSLTADLTSLYLRLAETGNQPAIAAYNVAPITAERSRTYDFGIDQNILRQKLILKAGYFHNQFNHQLEQVDANGLEQYFSIPANIATQLPAASLNSLAYRTQGLELEVQYQPFAHLLLHGGYTYLASLVEQSFAADAQAAANGAPTTNPNLPGIAIGALSPLVGSRPFRRPPSTGFFSADYTVSRLSVAIKGALASRSDDSTFQLSSDLQHGNTLLLPNRNLDFGYAKLDLNGLFALTNRITAFTQLDNLLSQQHIGPIGYLGLPFTIRAGLKIRIGGN
jgi:iron complex outermembrane receptor protein/vitamin B12 transporter